MNASTTTTTGPKFAPFTPMELDEDELASPAAVAALEAAYHAWEELDFRGERGPSRLVIAFALRLLVLLTKTWRGPEGRTIRQAFRWFETFETPTLVAEHGLLGTDMLCEPGEAAPTSGKVGGPMALGRRLGLTSDTSAASDADLSKLPIADLLAVAFNTRESDLVESMLFQVADLLEALFSAGIGNTEAPLGEEQYFAILYSVQKRVRVAAELHSRMVSGEVTS